MLEKETIQMIINYLQTKPYVEVYQLISKIITEANPQTEEK